MVLRTRVLVACLLVTTTGCAQRAPAVDDDGTAAEVLGVVVERTDDGSPGPTETPPSETVDDDPTDRPDVVDAPPEVDEPAELAAEEPPAEPPPPVEAAHPEDGPATTAAPSPSPSDAEPSPSEEHAPLVAERGPGHSDPSWHGTADGQWVELAGPVVIERGEPQPVETLFVRLVDVAPVAAPGATPSPNRLAVCRPRLQAPPDRSLLAEGTVVTELRVNDEVVVGRRQDVDVVIAAGERFDLPESDPLLVSSTEGLVVECAVRLE